MGRPFMATRRAWVKPSTGQGPSYLTPNSMRALPLDPSDQMNDATRQPDVEQVLEANIQSEAQDAQRNL